MLRRLLQLAKYTSKIIKINYLNITFQYLTIFKYSRTLQEVFSFGVPKIATAFLPVVFINLAHL